MKENQAKTQKEWRAVEKGFSRATKKQSKKGNLERDFGRRKQRKHEILDTQDSDFQLLKLNETAPSAAVSQPEPLINCFSTCVSFGDDLSSDGSEGFQLIKRHHLIGYPSPSSANLHRAGAVSHPFSFKIVVFSLSSGPQDSQPQNLPMMNLSLAIFRWLFIMVMG